MLLGALGENDGKIRKLNLGVGLMMGYWSGLVGVTIMTGFLREEPRCGCSADCTGDFFPAGALGANSPTTPEGKYRTYPLPYIYFY